MTLEQVQEQHPKFFSHPHFWIDAIEVEVNESFEIDGLYYTEGAKYKLSIHTLNELLEGSKLEYIEPLFKPQEGDAFIKDLQEAASAGCGKEVKLHADKLGYKWFVADANDNFHPYVFVTVKDKNISVVSSYAGDEDMELASPRNFNTAAYVDKLRELGYYTN